MSLLDWARRRIEDLFMARIVEKSYGHKLVWEENESGHSDRGAALAQVLPYALETLGAGPTVIVDDGLGDNLMRWINRQHRMQDQMEAWGMQ